ncbi:hypothetical protein PHYBOEH_005949 [Phytophthora boehmeriae]|uniref:M96 mating-specific protein family n=1 Tax=Phytophthora boehmeriae TaxID=109152 RepID=A0A8T1WNE2_9STRA|nr:hypothetical protein PHYBOEH_005949 [Phytophthora boehmeriae]
MTDSVFFDEVVGFLHGFDDAALPGAELVHLLDKEDTSGVSLRKDGSEIALQLVDISATADLFTNAAQEHPLSDSECTSCDSSSSKAASPVTTVVEVENVRSKDAIRRRSYRQKQKAQKDALYLQVDSLSRQLNSLLKTKEAAKAKQGLGMNSSAVWRALANRHLEARRLAEEQRSRLCDAVAKRSKLIQDLGALVRKRIGEEHSETAVQPPAKKLRAQSPDAALYETYLQELDGVYARVDDVFNESAMQESPSSFEFYAPSRANGASYNELKGMSTTPFAFDKVRKLCGQIQCMENRSDRQDYRGPGVSDGTSIVKIRVEDAPNRSFVQHAVMRKYYEAERVVIVWRKFTEGEGLYAGMHSDETGWNVVRPSQSCGDNGVGTDMESIIRYVPMTFSSAGTSEATLKQFTDMIIRAGEEDCQTCLRKMEAWLLDDALGVL